MSTTELRNVAGTHNPNYSSSKFLTTEERNAAIKAYTTGGEYPPSVLGKATALGVPVDSLVRLQAAGAGYKLGDRPTMPIPAEQPQSSQSSAPQQRVSFNPNQTEARALDVIGKYESDSVGGYNAVNQIGTNGGHGVLGYSGDIRDMPQHGGRAVTDMTIGEIMELQRETGISTQEWINSGKLHAVGRYQFIGPTFKAVVQQMGLSPDTKLTPDVQDAMALHLLRTAGNGIGQWVGPSTYATASERQLVSAARILRNPNATQAQQRRAYRTING